MEQRVLTAAERDKLRQLYEDHWRASTHAAALLTRYGLESKAFLRADKATGEIWRRIRELRGDAGTQPDATGPEVETRQQWALTEVGNC
jgi:hypothetical protein